MQPGDIVMIYQYPITQEDPEGRATLVRQISPDEGDGLSRWAVRFFDDPETCYSRTIYVDPLRLSERELRAICAEEIEVACDFDGYSPRLLVEHIAHCYNVPGILNDGHPIWAIAQELCHEAEKDD